MTVPRLPVHLPPRRERTDQEADTGRHGATSQEESARDERKARRRRMERGLRLKGGAAGAMAE